MSKEREEGIAEVVDGEDGRPVFKQVKPGAMKGTAYPTDALLKTWGLAKLATLKDKKDAEEG